MSKSLRRLPAPAWALCILLTGIGLSAQTPSQGQDAEFAKLVKEWTTRPEFLTPLVDHLPTAEGVPTPKDVLGYHIGAPGKLTRTEDALRYYRALEAKSPRVKVLTIGRTDEGREINIVVIASDEAVRNIDRYRHYLTQLGDPRTLTEAQAREIIASAKPIYHLMGGLHSGETGPPEMLMELAYRLAVEESPLVNQIRDNVIVTILPASDPDGRDRYVDWYRRHLVDITKENERVAGPPYWGRYVFHDNNRDINYSQVTMRAVLEWYLQWRPPIMHDLHESVPFLYTFSGQAPQNPSLDPILYGELPMFSNFEMAQLTKYGLPGVWTHGFVDMWSPGYLAFMSSNHNGLVRMYETFGNGGATTMKRTVSPPDGGAGQTSREWYRPNPPYKEVDWSMRNNTNFMQTGVLTALQFTSAFPKIVLENFYLKNRNAVDAGKKDAPFGFVIPAGQSDMTRVARLVSLLRVQGIEVGRTNAELKLTDGTFPAGSFVIKRDQPYGRLAKILLEKQEFPDPALRTYDDTGWTMGLMLQTEVKATADKAVLTAKVDPVTRVELPGAVTGAGAALLVANHGSNNLVTLRYRLKELTVRASEAAFKAGNVEYPAGSFIVPTAQGGKDVPALVTKAIGSLGLRAVGVAAMPEVAAHDVDLPRLAMFSTWGSTQEVGWVRHAFDQFELPFELIYKERVRKGNLRADYDLILIPSQSRSGRALIYDVEMRGKPLPYTKSADYPSHGVYGESDDIRGGMGLEGVLELQKFLQAGGSIVTLGAATFFPPEFGLSTVSASRPSAQFYAPGPIVQAEVLKTTHPIFYGYREKTLPVRYANGPLLQVPETDRDDQVLMKFVGGDTSVLSGLLRGATEIRNRPAIVEHGVGQGRLLMFATNPCYRWQNHGEFGMLFNTVLHWNDRPAPPPAVPAKKPATTATAAEVR
jgi:Zinc carboxypeptidase